MARVQRTTKVTVGDVSKETTVTKTTGFIFMFQVTSSNIAFIGNNENNMYVQYKNDTMYIFDNISKEQFHSILKSESVGRAILALNRKGVKI